MDIRIKTTKALHRSWRQLLDPEWGIPEDAREAPCAQEPM
jgi:hypothetical protein